MNPQAFVEKWQASPKREHVDSQPHFLDLCRLLDIEDPATANPAHEWFTFEKGATKTSGESGWADGWGDDWRAGTLTDDEFLARLFALNQKRAGKAAAP